MSGAAWVRPNPYDCERCRGTGCLNCIDVGEGQPTDAEKQATYAASRIAVRATAEAALAAAVAHTTRMEAAGYRLLGAVWVLEAGIAAGTAAEAVQQREIGVGVGVVGEGA